MQNKGITLKRPCTLPLTLPTHSPLDKSKYLDQNYCGGKGVRDEVLQIWTAGHFSLHIGVTIRNLQGES